MPSSITTTWTGPGQVWSATNISLTSITDQHNPPPSQKLRHHAPPHQVSQDGHRGGRREQDRGDGDTEAIHTRIGLEIIGSIEIKCSPYIDEVDLSR